MSPKSLQALIDRNAAACESARCDRCECRCGGKLHGTRHNDAWRREQLEQLIAEQHQDAHQPALFPPAAV